MEKTDPLEIIVDESDVEIGYKTWKEIDYCKDRFRASELWLENSDGDILLAQRSFNRAKHPGLWGPAVAGTHEKGESYRSNIIKEAEEELGLTDVSFFLIDKIKVTLPEKRYFLGIFMGVVDWPVERFRIQKSEVEQVKWFTPHELISDLKDHPEKYVPTMQRIVDMMHL